jgi:hypothetical protein
MKFALPCTSVLVALALSLGLSQEASGASQPAPAAPASQPVPPPKSIFSFDPKSSKDPFFPKTHRFESLIVKSNDLPLPPPPLFPEEIRCQGFSGTPSRPMVIINNKTVEKGEAFDLLIKGQRVRVRCVDILDKRVVLEVNGVTKELKLRTNFQ